MWVARIEFSPKTSKNMPPNPNQTPVERAVHIEDKLLAAEQQAAEELMRKREALRRAQAQRLLEEAAQRVHRKRQSVKLRRRRGKHGKCKRYRRWPGVRCWKKMR